MGGKRSGIGVLASFYSLCNMLKGGWPLLGISKSGA